MLSNTIRVSRIVPATSRLIHASSTTAAQASSGRDPRLSQGNVGQAGHDHPGDTHDQAARRGQSIGHGQQNSSTPYDAASRAGNKKTDNNLSGNKEGLGFAEQVGSASATSDKGGAGPSQGEGMGGQEESTPPGLFASLKSKLGLGTSSEEVKQNRGGGVGVTGTGALPFEKKPQDGRRPFHSSAIHAADQTQGQAPEASRQPKDRTYAKQNAHLSHKSSASSPDKGRGNAAEEPKLPSHQLDKKPSSGNPQHQQSRSFSTTLHRLSGNHTADSYFKDVDNTPPSSQKTHQVDSSATGPDVQRPNEPLTGEFSRAGANTKEYETVDRQHTYDTPPSSGPEQGEKLRYGNMPAYKEDGKSSGDTVSKSSEGPDGASRGGRKAEGRD